MNPEPVNRFEGVSSPLDDNPHQHSIGVGGHNYNNGPSLAVSEPRDAHLNLANTPRLEPARNGANQSSAINTTGSTARPNFQFDQTHSHSNSQSQSQPHPYPQPQLQPQLQSYQPQPQRPQAHQHHHHNRSATPTSIPSRPSSRSGVGVNFSRPNTVYNNSEPSIKLRQNSDSSEDDPNVQYYSPSSSPSGRTQLMSTNIATSSTPPPSYQSLPSQNQSASTYPGSQYSHIRNSSHNLPSGRPNFSQPARNFSIRQVPEKDSFTAIQQPIEPHLYPSSFQSPLTSPQMPISPTSSLSTNSSANPPNWQSFVGRSSQDLKGQELGSGSVSAVAAPRVKKEPKYCRACGEVISGQFVRALNSAYHIACFICADCGQPCSSKFFPVDSETVPAEPNLPSQVPLCERDYFRRLDLLCYVCDGALRGSYITALGRKYHVEHFTCSLCSTVFGPQDNYYEHEDSIYCHYHYSTLYAAKCEGCNSAILKQFVEIFRGGREQQWHPECYMIFKFWNVKLAPGKVLTGVSGPSSETDLTLSRDQVLDNEIATEKRVLRIWTVLCGYEEATAACISDMLQHASSGKFDKSLLATARLVSKIEILFGAIDVLQDRIPEDNYIRANINEIESKTQQSDDRDSEIDPDQSEYLRLGKEPKTLCKKVVDFMSLLSNSRELHIKRMEVTQLDLVSSLAHYLKLLIRHGLSNSLRYDRNHANGGAVYGLLDLVSRHELELEDPLQNLGVTALTSDRCVGCNSSSSIQDKCMRFRDKRYHIHCLKCSRCDKTLKPDTARVDSTSEEPRPPLFCEDCGPPSMVHLEFVSKLGQFVFLLKIALARFQMVLESYKLKEHSIPPLETSTRTSSHTLRDSTSFESPSPSSPTAPPFDRRPSDQGYMTTLTDIRRLRSTRMDQRLSESARLARKSTILQIPDSEEGHVMKTDSTSSLLQQPPVPPKDVAIRNKKLQIAGPKSPPHSSSRLDRTSDLLKNEKSLTLDDIPRIVAAEQAREQRPNAFKHQTRAPSMTSAPIPRSVSVLSKTKETKFLSEYSTSDMFYVRHIAVLLIHPIVSEWFSLDELLELIETRKTPSIWEKFGKAFGGSETGSKKSSKAIPVFGVALDTLVERYGVDSSLGVGPGLLRIPGFVDDCISSMRQKDMSVEGVFRKNGNIRRLKETAELIDRNPDKPGILSEENPVQLAALLKKFLRELPEPLLTFKLQKLWLTSQKLEDFERRKILLHLTCCLLPPAHRDVMEVLFYFLNWTASFSHVDEETGSKMDIHNLATVITPNILYSKASVGGQGSGAGSGGDSSGDGYFLSIEAVNVLIEQHDLLAKVPVPVLDALQHLNVQGAAPITTKEILTRFEQYKNDQASSFSRSNSTRAYNSDNTINVAAQKPGAIRVNTEFTQQMARAEITSVKNLPSPT